MTDSEAKDLKVAISARFPDSEVTVTPYPRGGDIIVATEGEKVRRYEIDDDYLTSPIVRLLVNGRV
jgi:hypothetical protein